MILLSLLYCKQKAFIWIWFIQKASTFGSWDPSSSTDNTLKITYKENFKLGKGESDRSWELVPSSFDNLKLKLSTPHLSPPSPPAPPCQVFTSPPATSRVPDKSSLDYPLTIIGRAAKFASIAIAPPVTAGWAGAPPPDDKAGDKADDVAVDTASSSIWDVDKL